MSGVGAGISANHYIALGSDSREPREVGKQSRGLRAQRVLVSSDNVPVVGYSSLVPRTLTLTMIRVVNCTRNRTADSPVTRV